jgi:hypothetical protein
VKSAVNEVHGPRSPRWHGNPRQYQLEAQQRFAIHHDRSVLPWSWITTHCEVDQCLDPTCMTVHSPIRIAYRPDVCVYCGEGCGGVDHLLPEPWTGAAMRHLVAVVPACANCNSRIGDFPSPNVAKRRQRAQLSIEHAHKRLLLRPYRDAAAMDGLGYAMRTVAEQNNLKADRVKARLGWPLDPYYDLRAFQKSGIEGPVSLGLCDVEAKPLRDEYREYA